MTASTPPRWGELLFGRWAGVSWTLCLGTGMHATAWYILATALPSAIEDVGGGSIISWVVSIYLIASIVTGSAAGLLKGRYGGRPVLLIACAVFLAGTAIAASAPSMPVVVLGRALQGAGEGVIWAVTTMLVKDLYPINAVPPMYAILAVVWALAALAGPLLSGILVELVSWRGALWSMAPLAVVFALLVMFALPAVAPRRAALSVPFGRLFVIGSGILVLSLGAASAEPGPGAAALVGSLVLIALALWRDRGATTRLFPRDLLALDRIAPLGLWVLALMFCAEASVGVYVPLLAQTVFGTTALVAGLLLAVVAFAWTLSALAVARVQGALVEVLIVSGPVLLLAGYAGLGAAFVLRAPVAVAFSLVVIGCGFGVAYTFLSQRVLANAESDESDVTAGAVPTFEAAGAAWGAALAGLVGNLAGIADLGAPERMAAAAAWVMGASILLALPAVAGALALARLGRGRA